MSTIKPFTINVPQSKLDDLRERLGRTVWPSTIEGQSYGGPELAQMKELARRAATFDWRKKEAELNELPNFITEIDGQNIHFIHVKSKEPGAIPLLLIHGWPGSVVEFLDHIGPLTAPAKHGAAGAQAFDVVIPSLPGVGFSGPTRDAGWNNLRIGKAFIELMGRLGYDEVRPAGRRRRRHHRAGDRAHGAGEGHRHPPQRRDDRLHAHGAGERRGGGHVHARREGAPGRDAGVHAGEVRLQPAAVKPAAAGGLRDLRLAGRADGLDDAADGSRGGRRAVPDQLHDLLADRHRRVEHPPVLRKCPRPRRLGAQGQLRRADRRSPSSRTATSPSAATGKPATTSSAGPSIRTAVTTPP